MSQYRHGNEVFRAQRLSDRISHSLDNEISPPYPESWRGGVSRQVVTEGAERNAGL